MRIATGLTLAPLRQGRQCMGTGTSEWHVDGGSSSIDWTTGVVLLAAVTVTSAGDSV